MKVEAVRAVQPIQRGSKKKIKGLDMEYCAVCGKPIIFTAFMLRGDYRYTYQENGKKKYCCGYNCLIKSDKKKSREILVRRKKSEASLHG